jgi:4-amino-4-deoxy-L-arabinose transferase-like glycosyltransferase
MSTSRAQSSFFSTNQILTRVNRIFAAILDWSARGLRAPLLAALLTFICAVPCAMLMPPLDRDESRFTQATAQMLETGDYVRIMLQDVPRNKKPVGIHWLQALSVALTSKVEARSILAYRWPSILGASLAAFACAWGAGKAFGTRTGLRAGMLFGVSFMLSTEAFWAKTDAVQCGFITLMMAALAQIYLRTRDLGKNDPPPKLFWLKLIFWLALAGTIMVKIIIGPMVLATTLLSLWILSLMKKEASLGWLRHMGWRLGLSLVLVICAPWFIAITIESNGDFWRGAAGTDFAQKLTGGSEGHFAPPGVHTLLLCVTLFPASFLLGGAIQTAIQRWREPAVKFALAWFVLAFIVFELTPTKLPHYPLPTFGALIWLCAMSLETKLKTWARVVNLVAGLLGGAVLTTAAFLGVKQFGDASANIMVVLVAVSTLVLGFLGWWLMARARRRTGLGFLIAAGVIGHLSVVSLLASLKPLWMSQQMEQALVAADLDPRQGLVPGPVASLGYSEPSFVFRMGTQTELLDDDASGAAEALKNGQPVFVEQKFEAPFQAAARAQGIAPHAVTQVKGLDYSNNHKMTITLYDNTPAPPKS